MFKSDNREEGVDVVVGRVHQLLPACRVCWYE